jgi:hypothetical protein
MWIFSQLGFFSIVKKPDGYHVRSRLEQDLVNLGLASVQSYPGSDYPWRTIVKAQTDWEYILRKLAVSVDYPNFKGRIAQKPDQKARLEAYHTIWALMAKENPKD